MFLGEEKGNFNLTALAIRLSSSVNGVSRIHGQVSSNMWRHLWPDEPESPVSYITYGVHTESWIGPEMRSNGSWGNTSVPSGTASTSHVNSNFPR